MFISRVIVWLAVLCFLPAFLNANAAVESGTKTSSILSHDGVKIAYLSAGNGETTLVFIHGGYADKGYWHNQVKHFAGKHRVIAVDLVGHGQSGRNRETFTMQSFARDVQAVLEKEKVKIAILIGNSLGGPVALETTALMKEKILGIVAVDTLNDIQAKPPAGYFTKLAQTMRTNYKATITGMAKSLFHDGEKNPLYAGLLKKMLVFPPEVAAKLLESFEGYDMSATVKKISHPIRCINGAAYPTRVENNRKFHKDIKAVIIPKTGHYPMLERPGIFNRHLNAVILELTTGKKQTAE
ncbi:MAG: alpha/beta hydrolase [bacterium]|nr:alpha/beta hydrolase [bacterium]